MLQKNFHNNNNSINKVALILSSFVHIILLLFLFWNIQWKNNQNAQRTIEVELYNEIPGNAATQKKNQGAKPKNNNLDSPKNKVIPPEPVKKIPPKIEPTPEKIPPKPVEKLPEIVDNTKADIELQKKKELEKLEQQKLEKERLEKQKQKELEKQKLEKQKQQEKLAKLEKEKKEKAEKEVKKDIPKFDFRDGIDEDIKDTKNQKAIASDKNRDGNITDKTRGGVGNVTGRNVSGNTMKKVKARNLDAYIAKIQNIVRSKVVLPPNVEGNPEMLLNVRQSQNGTILSVKITQSSGNELLDKAVIAAFHKSSPLPLPDDPDDFESILNVKYRPFN